VINWQYKFYFAASSQLIRI